MKFLWGKIEKQSTSSVGRSAEKAVSKYLRKQGFEIIELNWRTRYCEIDIVAKHNKRVYFTEVKYRKNSLHGDGFDYITKQKLQRMENAAESWVQQNSWEGEYILAAAEVDSSYKVNFVEI